MWAWAKIARFATARGSTTRGYFFRPKEILRTMLPVVLWGFFSSTSAGCGSTFTGEAGWSGTWGSEHRQKLKRKKIQVFARRHTRPGQPEFGACSVEVEAGEMRYIIRVEKCQPMPRHIVLVRAGTGHPPPSFSCRKRARASSLRSCQRRPCALSSRPA
eukprot:5054382-Pleurochrysis_carterae.AAC.6